MAKILLRFGGFVAAAALIISLAPAETHAVAVGDFYKCGEQGSPVEHRILDNGGLWWSAGPHDWWAQSCDSAHVGGPD